MNIKQAEKEIAAILEQAAEHDAAEAKKLAALDAEIAKIEDAAREARAADAWEVLNDTLAELRKKKDLRDLIAGASGPSPLISRERYDVLKDAIIAELRTEEDKAAAEVLKRWAEIEKIGEAMQKKVDVGDALLEKLQRDVYRDSSYITLHYDNRARNVAAAVRSLSVNPALSALYDE